VKVALSPASRVRGPLMVVGVFQLSPAQADAIDQYPHRALVVALASTAGTMVTTPFRQRVFFPDDVPARGIPRPRLFPHRPGGPRRCRAEGPFWVTVSLGEHLSNVVGFAGPPELAGFVLGWMHDPPEVVLQRKLLLVAVITLVPLHKDPKRPNGSGGRQSLPATDFCWCDAYATERGGGTLVACRSSAPRPALLLTYEVVQRQRSQG